MQNITELMRQRLEVAKMDCDFNIENYIRVLKSDIYRLLLAFMDIQYSDIKVTITKKTEVYEFDVKIDTKKIYDLGSITD